MSKFSKGLVGDIKKEQAFEERQNSLKEKYNIGAGQEVVVVEKSNMVKFSVKTVAAIIRTIASVCIIFLASVGVLALIYPNVRAELFLTWQEIYSQIQSFVPFLQ